MFIALVFFIILSYAKYYESYAHFLGFCCAFNVISIHTSNLSLYSLYYAKLCNEFAGHISASLRPGNSAPFEIISHRWRGVGNTKSDLTNPKFEPQTFRSKDERIYLPLEQMVGFQFIMLHNIATMRCRHNL